MAPHACTTLTSPYNASTSTSDTTTTTTTNTHTTVLVTGGCGFIGSHTAHALLLRGYDVVVVDEMNDFYDVSVKEDNLRLLQSVAAPGQFRFYRGDICQRDWMEGILVENNVETIIHLAGMYS